MTPSLPRFRSQKPAVGDRVVARRRIPGANVHWTDVIGHVIGVDPLVVRPQSVGGMPSDAEEIVIPDDQLEVIKILSPRTIRNSDIRAVEVATAKAFPGLVNEWHDGWLLRAGDGIAERSNSASPLGPSVGFEPVPMEDISRFYARHDLPVKLHIPERIGRPAQKVIDADPQKWVMGPEILVMTKSLDHVESHELPGGLEFSVDKQPDQEWLGMYHFRGQALPAHALELLRTQIEGRMGFGRLTTPAGKPSRSRAPPSRLRRSAYFWAIQRSRWILLFDVRGWAPRSARASRSGAPSNTHRRHISRLSPIMKQVSACIKSSGSVNTTDTGTPNGNSKIQNS